MGSFCATTPATTTQNGTTTSAPPSWVTANYQDLLGLADNTYNNINSASGPGVAGLTPQQQAGQAGVNAAQGIAAPYFTIGANGLAQGNNTVTGGLGFLSPAATSLGSATGQYGTSSNLLGGALPYYGQAAGLASAGTSAVSPTQFSAGTLNQYLSPYNQDVINSTMANLNQNDAIQANNLTGSAIMGGNAFGGDRAGVAQAELARNQDLANNQTIAGLENANYSQALGEFNNQQTTGLGAQEFNNQTLQNAAGIYNNVGAGIAGLGSLSNNIASGLGGIGSLYGNLASTQGGLGGLQAGIGSQFAALGPAAENTALTGAGAQLSAGQTEQQTDQNVLNSQYQQYLNSLGVTGLQTLAPLVEGVGGLSGGTTSNTSTGTQTPANNGTSNVIGAGLDAAALLGIKRGGRIGYDAATRSSAKRGHFDQGGSVGGLGALLPYTNGVYTPSFAMPQFTGKGLGLPSAPPDAKIADWQMSNGIPQALKGANKGSSGNSGQNGNGGTGGAGGGVNSGGLGFLNNIGSGITNAMNGAGLGDAMSSFADTMGSFLPDSMLMAPMRGGGRIGFTAGGGISPFAGGLGALPGGNRPASAGLGALQGMSGGAMPGGGLTAGLGAIPPMAMRGGMTGAPGPIAGLGGMAPHARGGVAHFADGGDVVRPIAPATDATDAAYMASLGPIPNATPQTDSAFRSSIAPLGTWSDAKTRALLNAAKSGKLSGFADGGAPDDDGSISFDDRAQPVMDAIADGDFDPMGDNYTTFAGPGLASIPMPRPRPGGLGALAYAGDDDTVPDTATPTAGQRAGLGALGYTDDDLPDNATPTEGQLSGGLGGLGQAPDSGPAQATSAADPPQTNSGGIGGIGGFLSSLGQRLGLASAGANNAPSSGGFGLLGMISPDTANQMMALGSGMIGAPTLAAGLHGGLESYQKAQLNQRDQARKDLTIQQRAQQLAQQAKQHADQIALETKKFEEPSAYQKSDLDLRRQQHADQLEQHYVPVGYRRTDSGLEPIPGGPQDPASIRAEAAAKRLPGMSDEALNRMVETYRAGNTGVLTGVGRGAQGADNLNRFWNIMADQLRGEGATGKDLAAAKANFTSQSAAARVAAQREATVGTAVEEAKNTFPLALQRSQELPRGSFVPWNRAVQAVQSGTSSPELARFVTANQAVITAYSQAMSRTGTNSVNAQHHAENLLSTATSQEAYAAVLGQMQQEMDQALLAPETVRKRILQGISGGGEGAAASGTSSAPAIPTRVRQNGHTFERQPDGSYKAID